MMTQRDRLLKTYSNWLRMRNYSDQTYKAYMGSVRNFWNFCDARKADVNFDKPNAVQTFLAYRFEEQQLDYSTVNGDYSALQWFYKYVLNREWNVNKLIRPKKEKRLPRYINPQQVGQLLEATSCAKHRLMMLMYYSTGIRMSEARILKWEDINFEEGFIMIIKGKGAKDRVVVLADQIAEQLKNYRLSLRPSQEYVFEGKTMGKAIAPKTVQWGFKRAREKAGLPNWVTAHVLRHSFATTSLKCGMDLLSLKELLGHKKLSTTMRYLHLHIRDFKKHTNPISKLCLSPALQFAVPPEKKNLDLPSDKSSENSETSTSKNTCPTIENEPS